MEATIVNYRIGRHHQKNNEMIIQINGIDKKEKAKDFIGKKVIWNSPAKKELFGLIKKEHGSKGALRVYFQKGLPGQSIGNKVKIE